MNLRFAPPRDEPHNGEVQRLQTCFATPNSRTNNPMQQRC